MVTVKVLENKGDSDYSVPSRNCKKYRVSKLCLCVADNLQQGGTDAEPRFVSREKVETHQLSPTHHREGVGMTTRRSRERKFGAASCHTF